MRVIHVEYQTRLQFKVTVLYWLHDIKNMVVEHFTSEITNKFNVLRF